MATEIITREDLNQFGKKLLSEIRQMLGKTEEPAARLLKSYQVKSLLKISPGTLQKLRDNGTLKYSKIGSIFYYRYDDVMEIFEQREKQ